MDKITKEVKKPVEAIQCANNFSLLQRKMYNVLLANAAGNLRPDVTHKINMGALCKLMGYKSRDYETIKSRFRELRRMDIEWDIINEKGNNVWTNTSPLSLARVTEGEGVCEYEFTKSLIPYLDRPAQYAIFSLAIQAKFKSSYGLALYENCERYKNIGKTRAFDIPTFRKLMGLKDTEYPDFFAMKRRVIEKAIKEVNSHADFDIKVEYEKAGKQTVKIQFFIFPKKTSIVPVLSFTNDESELNLILKNVFSLNNKVIDNFIVKYGNEYVKEKVNYVLNLDTFKKGEINNLAAYLQSAIINDYQFPKSSKDIVLEAKAKTETEAVYIKKMENTLADAEHWYFKLVRKEILEEINNLDMNEREVFDLGFEEYIKINAPDTLPSYKKHGLEKMYIFYYLRTFIENNYPAILNKLTEFNNFLKDKYPHIVDYYLKKMNITEL